MDDKNKVHSLTDEDKICTLNDLARQVNYWYYRRTLIKSIITRYSHNMIIKKVVDTHYVSEYRTPEIVILILLFDWK